MSARILVGAWAGLSVAFLAVPAGAEPRRVEAAPPDARQSDGESTPEPPETLVSPSAVAPASPPADAPASPSADAPASPSAVAPAAPSAPAPLDVVIEIPTSALAPRRPRFDVAVGMGGSFDSSGLVKGRTVLAPAFLLQMGVGDGPVGFEGRLLTTQASGRFHQMCNGVSDMAVDRLAIDLLFALRPFAIKYREDPRWVARFARSVALNLGASGEHGSVGAQAAFRLGVVVGAHIDLPVTPGDDATELRVRLGVRRMVGGPGVAGAVTVSDTAADVWGGLAVVF